MATDKKPRIRKTETVRERNEKVALKAEADAAKVKKRPLKRAGGIVANPFIVASKPFNVRPVRFVLRWIGRILVPRYFRNAFKELRLVKWPTRKETWKLTFAVLIFAVVFGVMVTLTDLALDKVIKRIVLR